MGSRASLEALEELKITMVLEAVNVTSFSSCIMILAAWVFSVTSLIGRHSFTVI